MGSRWRGGGGGGGGGHGGRGHGHGMIVASQRLLADPTAPCSYQEPWVV